MSLNCKTVKYQIRKINNFLTENDKNDNNASKIFLRLMTHQRFKEVMFRQYASSNMGSVRAV